MPAVVHLCGLVRNPLLQSLIAPQMAKSARLHRKTGRAEPVFCEFRHRTTTESWSRKRRVMANAERIEGKEPPRFVVTNLSRQAWAKRALYEELYCARGEMENRIKEQLSLFRRG